MGIGIGAGFKVSVCIEVGVRSEVDDDIGVKVSV